MTLEQEIQNLRDHCNRIIKLANQVGADNYPGFGGPYGINELLKSCDRVFRAADLADKPAMDHHIVLDLYRREDGGLRIAGRGEARGLILSGKHPMVECDAIWPALIALKHPITK